MKRTQIFALAVSALALTALFAWGTFAGADEVMGYVAGEGDAKVVAEDQIGARSTVTIAEVVAPRDAFVVVHQNDGGMPGKRVGLAAVKAGTTRDVGVVLDRDVPLTPDLLVALHADGGQRGKFEFDMKKMEHSPDRPFFVGGKEVAVSFKVAEFGVPVGMDEAAIEAEDQTAGKSVTISRVLAPADAFVVVHKATADGMPGERLGFVRIPAGESTNVAVELDEALEGETKLIAAIHADRGVPGELQFDMEDPVESPDQPYFVDGMEVAVPIVVE